MLGLSGELKCPPLRAHSIRDVSTSAVFLQNWSFCRVLEAAPWRSNSVFASFYFKDIQYVLKGYILLVLSSRLGPLLIPRNSEQTKSAVVWASTFFILLVLHLAPFRGTFFSFLREVISCAGAIRGDEGPPLRAHSIHGFSTSAVFLQIGRFLGCCRSQLEN